MTAPSDVPVHYLLCVLCHSESVFHYNVRFVTMLISLGSKNERFKEVAV